MLKLVKTIVSVNRTLVGFVIEGTEREFGGMSTNTVQNALSVKELIARKFNNNQIKITDGRSIQEKGGFRINTLPVCVLDNNQYIDIDNKITLVQRFVQNDMHVGFRVRFGDGSEANYKYENIIAMCKWFRPDNFVIRQSANNKSYIAGKAGCTKLADLPAVYLDEPTKKRLKSAAKDKVEGITGALPTGFDIIELYSYVDSLKGYVIKLPTEKYKAVNVESFDSDEANGFRALGIGEVASARPMFNSQNLNVNGDFKKVGIVPVEMAGQKVPITTYTRKTKSIFLNGENRIGKLGIAIPSDKEAELIQKFGSYLAMEKIENAVITKPLSSVIDSASLVFYSVDVSKLDLISAKRQESSILPTSKLYELLKQRYEYKLFSKFIGTRAGYIKELKAELGDDAVAEASGRRKFGAFAMMNDEALAAIRDAGIDIYTGAFSAASKADALKPAVKTDRSKDDIEEICIAYTIKGYDESKMTGKQVRQYSMSELQSDRNKVPAVVANNVRQVLSMEGTPAQRLVAATKIYNQIEERLDEIERILWMHNAAMYIAGGKRLIHKHDAQKWSIDVSSRVKTGKVYAYSGPDAPGLVVKVVGVDIRT